MTKDSNETKDNKGNSGKWSDPTSSYQDAQRINKFIEKIKDQKAQDHKDDDGLSS